MSDTGDQLCRFLSPSSPEVDSARDIHEYNLGTVQGDPMVMLWLNGLKSQLVQVIKLLMGFSGPLGGLAFRDLVPKEVSNSIRSTPIRGNAVTNSSNTEITATVT